MTVRTRQGRTRLHAAQELPCRTGEVFRRKTLQQGVGDVALAETTPLTPIRHGSSLPIHQLTIADRFKLSRRAIPEELDQNVLRQLQPKVARPAHVRDGFDLRPRL